MKHRQPITKLDRHEAGFTLIELSFSLLFIAFIMLFLISTMLNIMQTYNKGVWMNQINQAARQINSDISDQSQFSRNTITVWLGQNRLCIGNVAYLWNTAGDMKPGSDGKISPKNWFTDEADPSTKIFKGTTNLRFVRVIDDQNYCDSTPTGPSIPMPKRDDSNTSAMMGRGTIVQLFDVTESLTGLLRIHAVFSTEGDVQPQPVTETDADGVQHTNWMCGQVIAGKFTPGSNQYCGFVEFDIITYGRL